MIEFLERDQKSILFGHGLLFIMVYYQVLNTIGSSTMKVFGVVYPTSLHIIIDAFM
jgi:hypothetical protein